MIFIRNELFSKFQMLTVNIFCGSMAGIGIINDEDNYNVCLFSVTLEWSVRDVACKISVTYLPGKNKCHFH